MVLPNKIEIEVTNFLKPKMVFNQQYQQFKYDDKWIINIDEEHFKIKILPIIERINDQLINGDNNAVFLSYLIKLIEKKSDWFEYIRINKFDYLKTLKDSISVDEVIIDDGPTKELVTIEILNQSIDDIVDNPIINENYFYELKRYQKITNNYENPIDFELVKLLYAIKVHINSIDLLYHYIDGLLINIDQINFEKFDFEKYLLESGFTEYKNDYKTKDKCHMLLSKIEVAHFFHFLMKEELIKFSSNERKNKVALQQFIEDNFTYQDDADNIIDIKNINKEFSKTGFSNPKSQIDFIDKLIHKLKNRRSNFDKLQ